jgi:hypothetical protein
MDATGDADSGKPAKEKKKSRRSSKSDLGRSDHSKSDHRKAELSKSEHRKSEHRKSTKKSKKKSSSSHDEDVEWDKSSKDSDEPDWKSEEVIKSPSEWDPKKFDKQANHRWKDSDAPKHAQDLPSPAITDAPEGGKGSREDWPFKKTYAVDEKRKSKSKRTKDKGLSAPKREKSVDKDDTPRKEKRSTSKKEKEKEKKPKRKSSTSSSRRRRTKSDEDDEAAEVSDEDDQIIPLKGGDDDNEDDSQDEDQGKSGRRRMMKKKASERWNTAVEHEADAEAKAIIDERARKSLDDASDELEQYSGSHHSSASFTDDASYDSEDDEARSYDFDRSVGTYDSGSAEEGEEDYEEQPRYFQTPGMMDYDEEIAELMHKANPEYTEHLNRRVHRRKDNVAYDQNMPMMTRQALMTRQASAQAMRHTVDADSIDKGRLGFRNDSFHGRNASAQKPQRRGPGKRAPPRSKSSGLGTMQMASRRGGEEAASDDPRSRFRGRGASTSFQRYANKPNNVARMSGRRPEGMDRSQRGTERGAKEPSRRGVVKRSKSSNSLGRTQSADGSALKPERRARRNSREVSDDDSDEEDPSSTEEDEDEESDTESDPTKLRTSPRRRAPKKNVDKQDMTVKRHRRKLHGLMYQVKMSVEMKDLLKEVQKGEVPKSPIKSLLMDEP